MVLENLRYRPIRTLLSVTAIAIEVGMILTLVGLSSGMLQDHARRARGVGADILVRAPTSSILNMSSGMLQEGVVKKIDEQPHVEIATGVLTQGTDLLNYVSGIDLASFDKMSGGFRFITGGPFQGADDVLVDQYWADEHKIHVGDMIQQLNRPWRVRGIFEPGMLARVFVPLKTLQDLTANTGKVSMIYVKVDDPKRTQEVIGELRAVLKDYKVDSMEDYTAAFSVNNIPMLREFIGVVVGLGVLVGFLVVFLSMYTAVLERTREIGVLKALGASPRYILDILLRETVLIALAGSVVGIALSFLTRYIIHRVATATLIEAIVPEWWPIATAIAVMGAVLGAVYPGLKAARQEAVEALAYE